MRPAGPLALLLLAGCGPSEPGRLFVLGADGLDRGLVERMVAAGDLPAIARILREGVVADVTVRRPILSPVVWTTYASGYRADRHGVGGWTNAAGHPYTAADVRVMRLWDAATAEGIPTATVGWLMTWPASPVEGTLVSDRFVWAFPMDKPRDADLESFDAARHDALDDTLWPPDALDGARACVPDADALARHPLGYQVASFGAPYHPLQRDLAHACIARAAWREGSARAVLAYLQGPDQVSHLYWPFLDPNVVRVFTEDPGARARAVEEAWTRTGVRRPFPLAGPVSRGDLEEAARWVPDVYRFVDGLVAEAMADLGPRDTLVVLSDHGFRTSPAQPLLNGSHGDAGLLLAFGAAVAAPGPGGPVDETDVGATLLALAGLPVADDMPGRARDDLLRLDPPRRVPTRVLDRVEATPPPDLSAPYAALQAQLEALGYLDPGGTPAVGAGRRGGR